MVQGIIQRIGRILGGLVGCGLGVGRGRDGLLCGRLIILGGLELCLAGRDVVVHDVIVGGLRGIDCLLGNIDRGLLITERGGLGLTLVNSDLDVVVDVLCLLEGVTGGVDRIHEGGQLFLGRGACDLNLVVGICGCGIGGLLLLELLLSIIEVLAILGQGVRDGLDEVVLVLGCSESGLRVLDVLLCLGNGAFAASRRVCSLATACLAASSLTFAWSRAVWASAALDWAVSLAWVSFWIAASPHLPKHRDRRGPCRTNRPSWPPCRLRRIQLGLLLIERLLASASSAFAWSSSDWRASS